MKYVLEVNVDDKGYGGVFAFVRNIAKYIDRERFNISVCTFEKFEKESNKKAIEQYGGQVYDCYSNGNFLHKQVISCIKYYKLLKKERFDVIHVHSDVAYKLLIYGSVAKVAGIQTIIVHSHSSGVEGRYKWLKKILQRCAVPVLSKIDFIKVACSVKAAEWMYTMDQADTVPIINNGIELNKFRYDKQKYNYNRENLSLQDKKVIGTVARFSYQKYPEKLLEVFRRLLEINDKYVLLWVGTGSLREDIMHKAKEYGIDRNIIFYGNSDNVQDLYQAMDVFVLTSRFEGLCIAAVEAQAAGLPCLCSAEMSEETKLCDVYRSLSIKESDEKWAERLHELAGISKRDTYSMLKAKKYDLCDSVKSVEELYNGK